MLFSGEGKRMPDVAVPEGIVGGFEFSPDSRRLAFTLVGPTRNPDVWVLDLLTGSRGGSPAPRPQGYRGARSGGRAWYVTRASTGWRSPLSSTSPAVPAGTLPSS